MVCSLDPTVPVIADADTGFGGPAMIARTITQYARAGVAGLHIEDQVQTKRCGHLLGKQVVLREEFVTRIRAAVIARDSIPGSDFVIIGRTDSAQVLGMDEAIARLKLAADAGADVCFIEGVKSKELLESTVKALAPKPVSFGTQSKIYFLNPPSRSSSMSFLAVSHHPLLRRRPKRWVPKSSVSLYL
jgi:2-methylisocitrate lyase-like PEP mutase family enzyme